MTRPFSTIALLVAALSVSTVVAAPNQTNAVAPSPFMPQVETQAINPVQLAYNAQDTRLDDEERAMALMALASYPSENALVAVARGLKDESAVIRHGAIVGSQVYPIEHRWRMVSPLLTDAEQIVRVRASANLVQDFNALSQSQREQLSESLKELETSLAEQNDPESLLLLANVYRWTERWTLAEPIYVNLVENDQYSTELWLAYADNYRAQQLNDKAIAILDQALELNPEAAALYYSKSLALVRTDERKQAAKDMDIAANLAKDNSYYWYLNGVLQEALDIEKSTQSFETAYLISGAPEQLYALCDIYIRYDHDKSGPCMDELSQVAPSYVIDELRSKQNANVTQ